MIRWEAKLTGVAVAAALFVGLAAPAIANDGSRKKLDKALSERAGRRGISRVIVRMKPGTDAAGQVNRLGGRVARRLGIINGLAIELPNTALRALAERSEVVSLHDDRPTTGALNRTTVTLGARAVQEDLGFTGAGVGVAVVDSGITSYHDDLTYLGESPLVRVLAGQRTSAFVDFVNGRTTRYDDHGHGTHVAGIIAGNGLDSSGARAGIAPAAHLIGLKVLDDRGIGLVSNVIAALEWVIRNKGAHNIRVVNLSVGAAVTESYRTDPLTLAAKRVVDAGVVVVSAAGNLGKNASGQTQYGAITAPANAPWVLTVGASSHQGTVSRIDDVVAPYSSRGPSAIDFTAKPDIVAPGTGIVSLADPASLLYTTKTSFLLKGALFTSYKPYLSLTGTSMSAPMVSGTVALMLEANPSLTPNMVKAILQYTAQRYQGYDALTQGGGFLNARGAVQLAQFFRSAQDGSRLSIPKAWSKEIIWGNQRIGGGVIRPNANAFQPDTVWGAVYDGDGDNIVWGTLFGDHGDNIVWGTFDQFGEDNIVWGTIMDADGDNIVWGTWFDGDNIVWGTVSAEDNIVWGTDCAGADCDNIVWGTSIPGLDDNIVWGTAEFADNIVWGTAGDIDNIVWGTSTEDSIQDIPLFDDPEGAPTNFDQTVWENLFGVDPAVGDQLTQPVVEPTTITVTSVTGILGGGF